MSEVRRLPYSNRSLDQFTPRARSARPVRSAIEQTLPGCSRTLQKADALPIERVDEIDRVRLSFEDRETRLQTMLNHEGHSTKSARSLDPLVRTHTFFVRSNPTVTRSELGGQATDSRRLSCPTRILYLLSASCSS